MHWKRSIATVIAVSVVLSLSSGRQAIAESSTTFDIKKAPKVSLKKTRESAARHVLSQSRKHSVKAGVSRSVNSGDESEKLIDEGIYYFILADYEPAVTSLTKALELDPQSVDALAFRGYSYYFLSKYDEALADEEKAIELDPKWDMPFEVKGLSLLARGGEGNIDKGIEAISTAIELNPNNLEAVYYRGYAYFVSAKFDSAEADLTKVIEKIPNHYPAYFYRALTYVALKKYDAAKSDADKTIAMIDDGNSHELLGYVLEWKGDKDDAIAEYKKASELYQAAGDADRAKTCQESASRLETA